MAMTFFQEFKISITRHPSRSNYCCTTYCHAVGCWRQAAPVLPQASAPIVILTEIYIIKINESFYLVFPTHNYNVCIHENNCNSLGLSHGIFTIAVKKARCVQINYDDFSNAISFQVICLGM